MKLKVNDLIRFKCNYDSILGWKIYSFIKKDTIGIVKKDYEYHYEIFILNDKNGESQNKVWAFHENDMNDNNIEIISENKTIIYLMNKKRK